MDLHEFKVEAREVQKKILMAYGDSYKFRVLMSTWFLLQIQSPKEVRDTMNNKNTYYRHLRWLHSAGVEADGKIEYIRTKK
jgi:hypothetical protein